MSGYGISQHLIPINIVEKTKDIGNWYSDDSRHLKKIIMVFDESDRGEFRIRWLKLKPGHIVV